MHCKDCGFANGEDDHRCLRCGRRLPGIVIAAPVGYSGANALAMAPDFRPGPVGIGEPAPIPPLPLFAGDSGRNIIPFDRLRQRFTDRSGVPAAATTPPPATPHSPTTAPPAAQTRPPVKRTPAAASAQGSLDFVRAAAAPRTLKTDVPAQIFCEQTVATWQHRLVASSLDSAVILLAYGTFALIVEASGSGFGTGTAFWITMGVSFLLIAGFYGLIWAIAGRETAGMDMADLQLITFDGFPVDPRSRAIRFASTWLSFCSGGLGLVWAMADEENLTWHDHISKTFPTFREEPRIFVKQRRS
jgi:uncharacterized RDD family membrane protein YckC